MASPHDGSTLSELERQRLREIEEELSRHDGAFVARFGGHRSMRLVAIGVALVPVGLALLVATFTVWLPAGFAGAVVMAAGAGLAAHGGRHGGWTGWHERIARRVRAR